MRSLTCIIKYFSAALVLTNNVCTANECLYGVIENKVCPRRTVETQLSGSTSSQVFTYYQRLIRDEIINWKYFKISL